VYCCTSFMLNKQINAAKATMKCNNSTVTHRSFSEVYNNGQNGNDHQQMCRYSVWVSGRSHNGWQVRADERRWSQDLQRINSGRCDATRQRGRPGARQWRPTDSTIAHRHAVQHGARPRSGQDRPTTRLLRIFPWLPLFNFFKLAIWHINLMLGLRVVQSYFRR